MTGNEFSGSLWGSGNRLGGRQVTIHAQGDSPIFTGKETMTPRQRVLAALEHRPPDRVPIDLGGNQTGIHKLAYQALLEHLGIDDPVDIMDAVQQLARPCEAVLERFHVDTRYIAAGAAGDFAAASSTAARRPPLARPDR